MKTSPASNSSAFEAQNAAVRYGQKLIWSDVNIQVFQGQFVAVLGPNGAGKSTLIKAALGLMPLSSGSISILGAAPGRHAHEVGYLPQRRNFDQDVRVRGRDIVRLGLDGHRWGVPLPAFWSTRGEQRIAERVQEVIAQVGAADYADRPIGELSGGEQQRLLLAQALAPHPKLLLLDEPLDSLDLASQGVAAALIQKICREQNITVLMVAHDINPILSYLDQVIYVAAQKVVSGPPEEIITTSTLTKLYGVSVEVIKAASGRLVVVGEPEAPALHGNRHA